MSDWKPIAPAPVNADLELSIYDQGEYHAVVFPADATAQAGAMCADSACFEPSSGTRMTGSLMNYSPLPGAPHLPEA